MSGVSAVWYLLANDSGLLAQVPKTRIQAGPLPLKTELPAISVITVDAVPRVPVDVLGTARYMTERVQVTVLAKTYPSKKEVMNLVRKALPKSGGTVNGVLVDCILPDLVGPDIDDLSTQIYEQSRDFMVRWHEQ